MDLKRAWEGWQGFGKFLGILVGRLALSTFYFTVFVPWGIVSTLFADQLSIKTVPSPKWIARETGDQTVDQVLRQY